MKCEIENQRIIDCVSINIKLSKYDVGRLLESGSISLFPDCYKNNISNNIIITLEEEIKEK